MEGRYGEIYGMRYDLPVLLYNPNPNPPSPSPSPNPTNLYPHDPKVVLWPLTLSQTLALTLALALTLGPSPKRTTNALTIS